MNKLKYVLFLMLFVPFMVCYADESKSCTVVSGDGASIGSEIACGNEHFYIISSNENEIKMLAKYNLYTGINYNKIATDNNTYIKYECMNEECNSFNPNTEKYYFEGEQVSGFYVWRDSILEKYNLDEIREVAFPDYSEGNRAFVIYRYSDKYTEDGKDYTNLTYKLYPYTSIVEGMQGYGIQNALARGVTGEKGNANYPIIGARYLFPQGDNEYSVSSIQNGLYSDGYEDFMYSNSSIEYYGQYLASQGYDVESVELITIKEIDDLVKKVTNKNLPLSDWHNNASISDFMQDELGEYYTLGDLKRFLSNEYSWLWYSSYWTRTKMSGVRSEQVYFVASSGEICYSSATCETGMPRAGIRPVVTINKDLMKYNIYTKTDGKGKIEVVSTAGGGDSISFRATAKKGLKLSGLTITTVSNEKIEFDEEDLYLDDDGVYRISINVFTMPFENVTIEARWTKDIINPNTGDSDNILLLIIVTFISIGLYLIVIKKKSFILK